MSKVPVAEVVESRATFPSCGTELVGWLMQPADQDGPAPAIVMAPGLSGTKDGSLHRYGEVFARAGFAVLGYDNINFGESGGPVRQEADPVLQRRGYRDAITYMSLRDDVDASRIGIWGTSYSGGHVLEVAAIDRRVKCVVSQVAPVDGLAMRARRAAGADAIDGVMAQDREARFRGEPSMLIPAVSEDPNGPCVMPGVQAYEHFMREAVNAPNWRNELTMSSFDFGVTSDQVYMRYITPTPLMMVVALRDELLASDVVLEHYNASALEPKELVLLPGGHFTPYREEFELTSVSARDWFVRHLLDGAQA